jgi:hypothetical protein
MSDQFTHGSFSGVTTTATGPINTTNLPADEAVRSQYKAYNPELAAQQALAAAMGPALPDMPVEIQEAISEVQKHIEVVAKSDNNEFAKYKYASADAIYGQITNKLGAVGLVIAPYLLAQVELKKVETTDKHGNLQVKQWCSCRFGFALAAKGKTYAPPQFEEPVFAEYLGPQTLQAAKSYAQKSFLRGLFKIPTGEVDLDQYVEGSEDDADAPRGKPTAKGKAKAKPVEMLSAEDSAKERDAILKALKDAKTFGPTEQDDFSAKYGATTQRMTEKDAEDVRAAFKAKRG